jgi:mannose-6-phosphate isomerase-like protein (cupin superfamily)
VPDGNSQLQPLFWSEAQRGRTLVWPSGADWFEGDPLGPLPHTHPDASEVYFCTAGSFDVTIGGEEHIMTAGDFYLIPPSTYHHPRLRGESDGKLFVVVAPNFRGRRWKNSDFTDSDYAGQAQTGSVNESGELPSDGNLISETVELTEQRTLDADPPLERVIYVLDGAVAVSYGDVGGTVTEGRYLHIPSGHTVTLSPVEGVARVVVVASPVILGP